MSRNRKISIIAAAVVLVIAIIASLTEYRDVPTHQWKEKFNFDDEQPQGLYIFKELTNRYFKDVPITTNGYPTDSLNINSLYIQFVPFAMKKNVVDTLISIASSGNDVLIIEDFYNSFISDTVPQLFERESHEGSSLTFNFTNDNIASDTNFVFQLQNKDFTPKHNANYLLLEGFDWEDDLQYIKVATPDSLALMIGFPIGEGRIFVHIKKDLFYNFSYRQNQMFDYTQRLFSHFDPEHVYLLDPQAAFGSDNPNNKTPLDFIMSQPALKAAYYLLLLGLLLYVFFGGKRKQKIIPVIEKNKNTSLEYIETVSQLFYQQEQHEKLVAHMKGIFYHKMQKKFFVTRDDPDYVKVLAKKSKISATELQYIKDRFQNLDDNFSFRDDQLVSLNRRLEKIYKEIETG